MRDSDPNSAVLDATRIALLARCFEPARQQADSGCVRQEATEAPIKAAGRSHRYRPDIDGLRALAILPVILFHADLGCSGGFVGVDVFFVISGFLITSLILNEIDDNSFSLVNFWERRIRRIVPALVPVVFATLVAGWFLYLPHDFELLGQSTVAQAVLTSNLFFWRHSGYFDPGSDTLPLLHTWSLAVEEQFYLLFPLLLVFLGRRKRRSIAAIILCLSIGSFELSVLGSGLNPSATYYLLPTRAWELMVGALLAAVPGRRLAKPWWNEAISLSGLALILYSIFHYTRQTVFPGLAALPPCLGTALLIFSGAGRPTVISRALTLRPIVLLGLISYPLYLWHWPMLVFTQYISIGKPDWRLRVALLVLSAIMATLSWKFVETPFRKRLLCPRRPQVFAFASLAVLLLLVLGGGVYLQHGMPCRLPARALAYQNPNFDTPFFKKNFFTSGEFAELGAQSTNQPIGVLLWGDSHAMAVAPALDDLCRRFSVRGVQATHPATAPLLGEFQVVHRTAGLNAPNFGQAIVDFVAKRHVRAVVIAASWSYYPPEVIGTRLAATVQALMTSGAHVYVLKDVPDTGFDVPRFATLTALRHGSLAELSISPEKYTADNHNYEPIFNHLSQMGATILDTPEYLLNADGRYDVTRNGKLLYSDNAHLTVEGAKLLVPMFQPLFQARASK
jgi:peptidoglycan/LPS O-acetylase OafA/YrhL